MDTNHCKKPYTEYLDETINSLGEKFLIKNFILPKFNPSFTISGPCDDCAILRTSGRNRICISTDRVPADLIAFREGIMSYFALGYYLSVLNISDIAACAGTPRGLLLNFGLPPNLPVRHFCELLDGISQAATRYHCPVLGGDLSSALEMNLVATSIGVIDAENALLRSSAEPDQLVFCTKPIGVTPAAFQVLLNKAIEQPSLTASERKQIFAHFISPVPEIRKAKILAKKYGGRVGIDNTDGIAHSLHEIAEASGVRIILDEHNLPIPKLVRKIANHYNIDVFDLVFHPGADFQIVGTIPAGKATKDFHRIARIIGKTKHGQGVFRVDRSGKILPIPDQGWNYFINEQQNPIKTI